METKYYYHKFIITSIAPFDDRNNSSWINKCTKCGHEEKDHSYNFKPIGLYGCPIPDKKPSFIGYAMNFGDVGERIRVWEILEHLGNKVRVGNMVLDVSDTTENRKVYIYGEWKKDEVNWLVSHSPIDIGLIAKELTNG